MRHRHDRPQRGRDNPEDTRKLPIPRDENLSLESTGSQTLRGLPALQGGGSGYNPYDTVPNAGSSTGMQRLEDMRRLSEWIRMKRNLERDADKDDKDK